MPRDSRRAIHTANGAKPSSSIGNRASWRARVRAMPIMRETLRTVRNIGRGQMRQPAWIAQMPPDRFCQSTSSKPAARIIAASSCWGGNLRMLSTRYW